MNAMSPWGLSGLAELAESKSALVEFTAAQFCFKIVITSDSLWIQTGLPGGGRTAFRAAYSPGTDLRVVDISGDALQGIDMELSSAIGKQRVSIKIDVVEPFPVLRYRTV